MRHEKLCVVVSWSEPNIDLTWSESAIRVLDGLISLSKWMEMGRCRWIRAPKDLQIDLPLLGHWSPFLSSGLLCTWHPLKPCVNLSLRQKIQLWGEDKPLIDFQHTSMGIREWKWVVKWARFWDRRGECPIHNLWLPHYGGNKFYSWFLRKFLLINKVAFYAI